VGWHTFRHSLATLLVKKKEGIKVAQELMRHADSRTTLDIYASVGRRRQTRRSSTSRGCLSWIKPVKSRGNSKKAGWSSRWAFLIFAFVAECRILEVCLFCALVLISLFYVATVAL
jgi:hypothetical protein